MPTKVLDGRFAAPAADELAVCPGRGWPSWTVIYKHATPGRKTNWEEIVALGRRYLAEQRRAA